MSNDSSPHTPTDQTTVSEVVEGILTSFSTDFQGFQNRNAELIKRLNSKMSDGGRTGALSTLLQDNRDALDALLGAQAANAINDSGQQDEAISAIEQWVSENVSMDAAMVLWCEGTSNGENLILAITEQALAPNKPAP